MPGTFKQISDWGIRYLEDGNDGTYGYTMEEYQALMAENNLEMVSVSAPFEELETSLRLYWRGRKHTMLNT